MRKGAIALTLGLGLALMGGCGSDDDAGSAPDPASSGPTTTSVAKASPELTSALDDVRKIAPALESLYRNREYPRKLDDVIASLEEAKLTTSDGNSLGAYAYDEKAVEFTLCVENASGAFAIYDTAPMALGEQGEDGGCPAL